MMQIDSKSEILIFLAYQDRNNPDENINEMLLFNEAVSNLGLVEIHKGDHSGQKAGGWR